MSGIEVTGGVAGLSVGLAELEDSAHRLRGIGTQLTEIAVSVASVATEPRLVLAGVLAPRELMAVELALLGCSGASGVAGAAADVVATSLATTTAVRTYRAGEGAAEALTDGIATAAGRWVGRSAGPVLLGAGVVVAPVAAAVLSVPAGRDAALAVGLGLGREVDEILFDHPWLVPVAADGLDGLVLGLGEGVPALGVLMARRSGRAGASYPPRTQEEALAVVLATTRGVMLDESSKDVRLTAHAPRVGVAPRGVGDLVTGDGPTSGGSRVRVSGIPQPDGSWTWVVDVPGTQTFDPRAGSNPYDMTSNILLAAGQRTRTMQAVVDAVEDARRRTGDTGPPRVMVTGHSQGGLTAAALAADPAFRARLGITHVVTSAAPVARLDIPQDVSVLSLEHTQDLVPASEGADNPDRASWVSVERSIADELGPDGRATQAHDNGLYADTARMVDASDDPSIAAWRDGAAAYVGGFGGPTVTIDYDIERR
ncbi:hypothetical protein ASG73_14800 [Janibacter sp. Soil728]|uniref:PGAP1-like alpha/beta domain-containing protein n=1 Tax=Janibacter sp. Soil728 TaxID=1736393 RepID=UPI0006FC9A52|nr:hypothetical protein [Janibacter sp. Soil728]KRE35940.1 hypothetical protein ASG73_14800 [Janibacter sp. Soil728]